MNKLRQARNAKAKIIGQDSDTATVFRKEMVDNGRGGLIPAGNETAHKLTCRVCTQSASVYGTRPWEGGLSIDKSPYVLAFYDADLQINDVLEWRGRKYTVGVVSRPEFDGGIVCVQAPLVEVKNG